MPEGYKTVCLSIPLIDEVMQLDIKPLLGKDSFQKRIKFLLKYCEDLENQNDSYKIQLEQLKGGIAPDGRQTNNFENRSGDF